MVGFTFRSETENFRKLKQTLTLERNRTKTAADRDSETIIELRTSLEMEREKKKKMGDPSAAAGLAKIQRELKDERARVDALKQCLEQARTYMKSPVVNQ